MNGIMQSLMTNNQWFTFLMMVLMMFGVAMGALLKMGSPVSQVKSLIFWIGVVALFSYFAFINFTN